MNNEPVVWLVQYKDRHEFRWSKPEHLYEALACEPLYTHPAKEEHFEDEPQAEELHEILQSNTHPVKELTDEEIMAITKSMFVLGDKKMICDFARAILRKEQEK